MKKQYSQITNTNYMEFVKRGKDADVTAYLQNMKSTRKSQEYLTKIISFINQIGDEDRYNHYTKIKMQIDEDKRDNLIDIINSQKNITDMLELCKYADTASDRAFIATELTYNETNLDNYDDDEDSVNIRCEWDAHCLKYASTQDKTNEDILRKLMINLVLLGKHNNVLKICKESPVANIVKSGILWDILDSGVDHQESSVKYEQEILRLDPEHPYERQYVNTNHSEANTMLSGDYSQSDEI